MTDDQKHSCDRCPSCHAVNWSPVFAAWLCPQCRWVATEKELGPDMPRFITEWRLHQEAS
jgi:hypothetical protein